MGWLKRYALGFFVGMCILAAIAGMQVQEQKVTQRVPNSTVSNMWCVHDGGTKYVYMYPNEDPYIYSVRCKDGVLLTAGIK